MTQLHEDEFSLAKAYQDRLMGPYSEFKVHHIPVLLACFSRNAFSTASGDEPD